MGKRSGCHTCQTIYEVERKHIGGVLAAQGSGNLKLVIAGLGRYKLVSGSTGYGYAIEQPLVTGIYVWNADGLQFAIIVAAHGNGIHVSAIVYQYYFIGRTSTAVGIGNDYGIVSCSRNSNSIAGSTGAPAKIAECGVGGGKYGSFALAEVEGCRSTWTNGGWG